VKRGRRAVLSLWAIAAALAVGLVLGVGGLWTKKSTRAPALVAYIKAVDGLEQQLRLPLTKLVIAYRNFSVQSRDPRERTQLAAAERTFLTLESRLSALAAPAPAAELRTLLVRTVRAEDGVAGEIAQLDHFAPAFDATVGAVARANKRLAGSLAAYPAPKARRIRGTAKQIAVAKAAFTAASNRAAAAQADALDAFDSALAGAQRRLRTLRPPPVMSPAYGVQVLTLESTQRAGSALANELRTAKRTKVPLLMRSFMQASRLAGSVGAQKAEIAAIETYNRRVRAIATLQTRVRDELQRLQRRVG
jgi:hypothetical protein